MWTRRAVGLVVVATLACTAIALGSRGDVPEVAASSLEGYLTDLRVPRRGSDHFLFPSGLPRRERPVDGLQLGQQASCGLSGCHADITRQWAGSMHRFASFNNELYSRSIERMRSRGEEREVRWCAGCHDPVLLLSGSLEMATKRSDPGADAGVSCLVCHRTVALKDKGGNGAYVIEEHPLDFLDGDGTVARSARWMLMRFAKPHRDGLLKPLHQTAEFCSTCHRVSLKRAQTGFTWQRGQDQFGGWQAGGPSGRVTRSMYTPEHGQRCQDCHMPLVASQDAGNDSGFVRSHMFPGANTLVPTLEGQHQQAAASEAMLQGSMRLDIFAVRMSATDPAGPERWWAPAAKSALPAGAMVTLDLVVRNLRVGHAFPEGVLDNKDVWIELVVRDARRRVLFASGGLDSAWNVRPATHRYGAIVLDSMAQRIAERNILDVRTAAFRRVIGPGQSDIAQYRFRIPRVDGGRLNVEARLRYRKATAEYLRFAYGAAFDAGSVPIVDVARATATFGIGNGGEAHGGSAPGEARDAERWHDYGHAWLSVGDLGRASRAFAELQTRHPASVHGHIGAARVALAMRDAAAAIKALEAARELMERTDPARLPRGTDARVAALWGEAASVGGDYERAILIWTPLLRSYPQDAALWRDIGFAHFQLEQWAASAAAYEKALGLDPDDRAAYLMLARANEAMGGVAKAAQLRAIADELKEDATTHALRARFLAREPAVAAESRPRHIHELGPTHD